MGKIFITGDVHCDIDIHKLTTHNWLAQKNLTYDDVLIIAGDFGAPWGLPENKTDKYILKWHNNKPYTTLFIDGNHENFDALDQYPKIKFANAICQEIRPHVLHVMRGEVLHLNNHKIWCMGGGISSDKKDRKEHISWWSQEEPSQAEWAYAFDILIEQKPDIIVTHEVNANIASKIFSRQPDNVSLHLNGVLNLIINNKIPIKDWYFGHYHTDYDILMPNEITYHELYQRIVEIK